MKTTNATMSVLKLFITGIESVNEEMMQIIKDKVHELNKQCGRKVCDPRNIHWERSNFPNVKLALDKYLLSHEDQCIMVIGPKRSLKLRGYFRKKGIRGHLPKKCPLAVTFYVRVKRERRAAFFKEFSCSTLFLQGLQMLHKVHELLPVHFAMAAGLYW